MDREFLWFTNTLSILVLGNTLQYGLNFIIMASVGGATMAYSQSRGVIRGRISEVSIGNVKRGSMYTVLKF